MSIKNQAAFPIVSNVHLPVGVSLNGANGCGLTKLEYFAAAALQGLIVNMDREHSVRGDIAQDAVNLAHALIWAMEKEENK